MIDTVIPDGKWEFNESVSGCFADMLSRSIPQYDLMRDSVANLIYSVAERNKHDLDVLDIGCSDGLMIEKLLDKFNGKGYYTGIDISTPMLLKAKERFRDKDNVDIFNCDLRTDFPICDYNAITSILSIQFTPIEYRQRIIQNIYNHLTDKGCFIMVEKVLGNTDILNELFVRNYYAMKKDNGYTDEQIERKRLSLEGVLVPVTSDWNVDLLKQAGFRQVDVFWKWMNFTGYIAIK